MANPWEEYQAAPARTGTVSVEPWTEYQGQVVDQPTREDKISNFQYIANQAKLGLTDSLVLGEAIIDTFAIDPFANLVGKGAKGGIVERFGKNVKRLQEAAGTDTGAQTEMPPPSAVAEVVGSGARMLTDPLGYLGSGALRAGASVVERVAPVVGRAGG